MKYITCHKCGKRKPETEYSWADKKKGVRQRMCRSCFSEYNAERYRKHKAEIKAKIYKYRRENPENVFRTRLRVYEKNPTRYNGRKLIEAAKSAGIVSEPDTCQICGKRPEKRLEMHHEDYAKPLDIIWCCTKCHESLDISRRRREGKPYHSGVRPVLCVETGEVYPSIAEAARSVERGSSSVSQCLAGKSKTCAGFHWRYEDE